AFKTIPFHERDDSFGGPDVAPPPVDLPLIHAWGSGESVFLHPYLCTRPYVLKLRDRLRIAPGRHCRFTVALPPLLKFELTPEKILAEEMPFTISKTFSGPDSMHGEICHSLPLTFFCHDTAAPDEQPCAGSVPAALPSALIFCDITIMNNTKAMLEPDSVTVNPEPLSVYVHHDRLVTDALELDFSETDCRPRINKTRNVDYHLVSAGVKYSAGESFARRSVDIIKDITSI
ncbi:MAG: hypothetical protein FWD88_08200, partial [Treponema sp.]|nr:hypothetical protein [Treponema sp.]